MGIILTLVETQTQGGRTFPHPGPPQHYNSYPTPPAPRHQLTETDYCPICHIPLPYLADPSEAGRETHIEGCIAAATGSPPPSNVGMPGIRTPHPGVGGGRGRSYTNAARMIVWKMTEKEREKGMKDEETEMECVICFEEFDVGQEVARLECLCRYHKVSFHGEW